MGVVIDLSDFQGFDAETTFDSAKFEANRISSTTLRLNSKTADNSFIFYRIPGRLPVGTKVTLVCETRAVSGQMIQLSIDSYSSGNYSSGKAVESNVNGDSSDEFVEKRVNTYVKPGQQYLRVVIGFFSARIGIADIRAPRIIIDGADIATVKPEMVVPATMSRFWSVDELNREWVGVSDRAGTITRLSDKITLSANLPSRAYVRYAASNDVADRDLTALWNIEQSNGFSVSVKGVRRTGLPSVAVEYLDSSGATFSTLRGLFLGSDNDWCNFWFPPISGANRVHIAIGFFTNNDGDFDIKGVKISQYGAAERWQPQGIEPIMCAIRKESSVWSIDNNSVGGSFSGHRFASASVASLTVNASSIDINFASASVRGYKPFVLPMVDDYSSKAAKYYAVTSSVDNSKATLTIYDRATRVIVPPASVDNGTFVQVIGMGMR